MKIHRKNKNILFVYLFRGGVKTEEFSENCSCERHNFICEDCLNHIETFDTIAEILNKMENKWLSHKFNLAASDILQLKMHLLRAVHQDRAKTDLYEKLSETRALVIFDFAMKFLPQKYREAQVDFFGEKGTTLYNGIKYRFLVKLRSILACDGVSLEI